MSLVTREVEPWTGGRVQARMAEAMETQQRLSGSRGGPSNRVTSWPDIVRNRSSDYADDTPRMAAPTATPRELQRLEEVERWISRWLARDACLAAELVPDTGWIVTCRALGWTYARIGAARKTTWRQTHGKDAGQPRLPGGNSRPSLVAIERRGLRYLATRLNLSGVPVDPETLAVRS